MVEFGPCIVLKMVEFGSCIVLIWPNSVCIIQVITRIHVKSFEKIQITNEISLLDDSLVTLVT